MSRLGDIFNAYKQSFPGSTNLLDRARDYHDLLKTTKGLDHPETANMAAYNSGLASKIHEVSVTA